MAGLMAGPTERETAEGLTTYIPDGTRLKSVTLDPAQYGIIDVITRCTKGGCKPDVGQHMPGAGLT